MNIEKSQFKIREIIENFYSYFQHFNLNTISNSVSLITIIKKSDGKIISQCLKNIG